MPKAAELRAGMVIEVDGQPYIVRQVQAHNPTARGATTLYKTRMNHARSRQKLDASFKGDDFLPEVDFRRRPVQFLYADGEAYTFMETADYTQHTLDADQIDDILPFLTENADGFTALILEDACVGIEAPGSIEMNIIETAPAMKGASQSSRSKTAKLETGLEIQVPEYLASGERIRINTATREYLSRA